MLTKEKAKDNLVRLIKKFESEFNSGRALEYNEEATKTAFIQPLLKDVLGWDVTNRDEVSPEEKISRGRVDYGLKVEGKIKVLSVGIITFEKGGMTKMHTHDHEQVIYALDGKGRVVTEKEEKIVGPGTFVFFPPGERHAHGAPGDSRFVQMTITNMGSGAKYKM